MILSSFSIRRKIATTCLVVAMVLLGLKAYRKIGIDLLPKFDLPYVQATVVYPGASPEEMEVDVARRIEDAVASIDGLKHVTTVCMEDAAALTLEFVLGTDVDLAIHEVREKINSVIDDLPDGVETPQLDKININAVSVVTMHLTGSETIDRMYDYVDDRLSDQFACIPGVGEVRVHGGNEVQMHVLLDRTKLAACNLSVAEVVQAIAENNVKIPAGRIKESGNEMTITYDAEFHDVQSLKDLEIAASSGVHVYLGDVADVALISKEIRQDAVLNETENAVCIEIIKKSDANAVEVIRDVRAKFEELTQNNLIPGGMRLSWFKDSGEFIQASVVDAWECLLLGIVLTALLLFLFLHDPRSTFIVSITMPVSVAVSFIAMELMGYTFDMMTLVALGCSSGILVANSVVVIENISKKLRAGLSPETAAIQGTDEVANAVSASALTNVVVFVPVVLMSSVVGLLIAPFAGVMVIATLVSLFVSFTLTPLLAAKFLSPKAGESAFSRLLFSRWDVGYAKLEAGYVRSLAFVRKHSVVAIVAILALCAAATAFSLPRIGISFIPTNDKGELSVALEFPSNFALSATREQTLEIVKELRKELPYLERTSVTAGYRNVMPGQVNEGVNLAEITLMFQPKDRRPSLEEIKEKIRSLLAQRRDVLFTVSAPQATGLAGSEISAYVSGPDLDVLEHYALLGADMLRETGIGTDIDTNVRAPKPRVRILPDRPILKGLGMQASTLGTSLAGYFDGVERGSYKIAGRSYDIRIRTKEASGFDQIGNVVIGALNGNPINLDALAYFEKDPVSVSLQRQDKERAGWIYANPAPGFAMGDVVSLLEKRLAPQLPPGYRLSFFGQSEKMKEGVADYIEVFITAIVMTYLLIAAMMESWSRPFLVMFTIPLGFVGMILMLAVTGNPLSMAGMLGAVMMIGIVVNNAILMLDECAMLERRGVPRHDAMIQAAREKFRPILMTSIAGVVGMLPMAFGSGMGSEIRSSCGIGVVGGLAFSAVLTFYLIPALFFLFQKNSTSASGKTEAAQE